MQGQSIKLFLVDGSPSGIVTVEIMNWTGHLIVGPRSRIDEVLKRPEASRTGIYFLLGDDPASATRSRVYVGEGDVVSERLRMHSKSKDFWDRACIVTSKDANLTKAHVRYLEKRILEIAKTADRVTLDNGNEPSPKSLPESDLADMEGFIAQILVAAPTVGFDFLRGKPGSEPESKIDLDINKRNQGNEVRLKLESPKNSTLAISVERNGEVTVFAGAKATAKEFTSNNYSNRRNELIASNVLVLDIAGDSFTLTKDTVFRSPSEAAAVLLNRNSNGRTEWRLADTGQTLKAWQDAKLDRT